MFQPFLFTFLFIETINIYYVKKDKTGGKKRNGKSHGDTVPNP